MKPLDEFHRQQKGLHGRRSSCRSCMRAWREANADYLRVRRQAHYARNRDHILAQQRGYKAANPDVVRASNDRRRAITHGVDAEPVDRAVVWARDAGVCHVCRLPAEPTNWHLDHVIPISRGGPHSYDNTAVSHPACNLAKGAHTPSKES